MSSSDADEYFVLIGPPSPDANTNANESSGVSDASIGGVGGGGSSQRLECGCPPYRPRLTDVQSVVASVSLSHTVVQDPNRVLAQLPRHRKSPEERLFLLDAWLRRPALYYTSELIHAFIDAFAPMRLQAGKRLIRERDAIKHCHLVYKGQLKALRNHPSPCGLQYHTGVLESGAELFSDPLCLGQVSQFSYVAAEDSLLFSLGLKDLGSLNAAANEIRRGAFLECLRSIKYLRPLPAREMHALAESWDEPLKTFDYEAGYVLQEEGSVPDRLYCILQGGVSLTDSRGFSARRGAGQTVCCQALLRLPSPYTATVEELSTLVSLEVGLCPRSISNQLMEDPEALERAAEELRSELARDEEEAAAAAAAAVDLEQIAEAAAAAEAEQARSRLNLPAVHRRSVLRLCRIPQLSGLLRPTELDSLFGDRVQMATHILTRQKNDCLYAEGIDYAKYVYVVLEGELRETAPVGPHGSHALLNVIRRGGCACLESLLLQSACLCQRSAYANTACTVVALDVDAMEEALCRSFISVMKRRTETFRQSVGAAQLTAVDDDRAFRDEVFPPTREEFMQGSSERCGVGGLPTGRDELTFKALAVMRLVAAQIRQLLEPLGDDVLTASELRSLRLCHRAVIIGGRGGGSYSDGELMVTEEASRRRIIYFLQSGEAEVSHTTRCGGGSGCILQERPETRPAGSLLCPEQLFLPAVCCYEARAKQDGTELALVNQHVLETAIGCEFREVFLRRPEAFRAYLTARYPGVTEADLQVLTTPATAESSAAGRVCAFGLEALMCHPQVGRLFTDRELQRLKASQASVMSCIDAKQPNQSIFLEGSDQITSLFIVYSGRVTSSATPGPNRPSQLLDTHESGELVGTEALLRQGLRSTSAYAASAAELIVVPVEKIEAAVGTPVSELLARDQDVALSLFRRIFQPGVPLPRDGWRPGVDPQRLLSLQSAATSAASADSCRRRMRGRHLRVEAEILREAEGCSRVSNEFSISLSQIEDKQSS